VTRGEILLASKDVGVFTATFDWAKEGNGEPVSGALRALKLNFLRRLGKFSGARNNAGRTAGTSVSAVLFFEVNSSIGVAHFNGTPLPKMMP